MTRTGDQIRHWQGPALLSFGFRPFFLLAALWAALAMALWVPMLAGALSLPTRLGPTDWHAQAFLFGYTGAAIAGFLLTAVPNWTGRLPVVGWRLAGLVALWLAGRGAGMVSAWLSGALAPALSLAFPVVLGALILREIVAGRNWRNLIVLALLAVFALAELLFYLRGAVGLRLGLAAVIGMIAVIGGRIVPSFTRNWLVKQGPGPLPVPPMQRFDKITLAGSVPVLALWVVRPDDPLTGVGLMALALAHGQRLSRWQGARVLGAPLLAVLHLAYAMVPIGALMLGLAGLGLFDPVAAQHVWMAGAIGLMTLAVMSRATLGHTGRDLQAGAGTVAVYAALTLSVGLRVAAGLWPVMALYHASGALWIAAFLGFAGLYGPALTRPRVAARRPS